MISPMSTETVVLVHGLAANRLAMIRLAKHLAAEGYRVENGGYDAWKQSFPATRRRTSIGRASWDLLCEHRRIHMRNLKEGQK